MDTELGSSMRDDVPAWLAHPVVRRALALNPALADHPDPRPYLDQVRRMMEAQTNAVG